MGKLVLKIVLLQLFLTLFFFFFQNQIKFNARQIDRQTQTLGVENQKNTIGLPKHLLIPAIKVDTYVQQVGVTDSGAMAIPDNSWDVGWFAMGPRPGEVGSAVIAGHLDSNSGGDGVFINLNQLRVGDKLYIEDDQGVTTTFIVRESRVYDPGYADEVFNQSEGLHLNLVTCDGAWDGNIKSYSKRLVIFTDKLVIDK